MTDDEDLERSLANALDADAPEAPPEDRIAALRARADSAHRSRTPITPVVAPLQRRRRRGVSPWLAAAAAVVGLVVGAGVTWLVGREEEVPDEELVAGTVEYAGPMAGPDGRPAEAQLSVIATGIGRVVELDTAVLPILPTGELYEVWFVGPDDAPGTPDRISAGTFHPDRAGLSQVRFAAAVDPALYPVVEITAEPGDGNPAATGTVVLRAEL